MQRDGGEITDSPFGTRIATRFKKLPIASPKTAAGATTSHSGMFMFLPGRQAREGFRDPSCAVIFHGLSGIEHIIYINIATIAVFACDRNFAGIVHQPRSAQPAG